MVITQTPNKDVDPMSSSPLQSITKDSEEVAFFGLICILHRLGSDSRTCCHVLCCAEPQGLPGLRAHMLTAEITHLLTHNHVKFSP